MFQLIVWGNKRTLSNYSESQVQDFYQHIITESKMSPAATINSMLPFSSFAVDSSFFVAIVMRNPEIFNLDYTICVM